MIHKMKLNQEYFEHIKNGQKTIEMRLFDEKRRLVKPGDKIEFENRTTGETLLTEVVALHIFKSFDSLYGYFDKTVLGYNQDEIAQPSDMGQFYSKEEQEKYGVVGIEIRLI